MAKVSDRVPIETLGTSRLSYVFLKIYPYGTSVRQIFCKLRKCAIKSSSKSVLHIFLKNFGSKRDSPQQIIIGCTVGFLTILDQRQVFTTLDEN